ncbi:Uncharacterised protein [Vibrio cholerae]|nr:Uncharacterised protein [Vibrio cholerae]CSH85539.1 Uncharacterised protein [Vibrio cholerae]
MEAVRELNPFKIDFEAISHARIRRINFGQRRL